MIERLLGVPLALLDAVHRHAHHRRHGGRDVARLHDLPAVEQYCSESRSASPSHGLCSISNTTPSNFVVLDRERGVDLGRLETREGRLPRFERADHTVETR